MTRRAPCAPLHRDTPATPPPHLCASVSALLGSRDDRGQGRLPEEDPVTRPTWPTAERSPWRVAVAPELPLEAASRRRRLTQRRLRARGRVARALWRSASIHRWRLGSRRLWKRIGPDGVTGAAGRGATQARGLRVMWPFNVIGALRGRGRCGINLAPLQGYNLR